MKSSVQVRVVRVQIRGRGRPRLANPNRRLECMVPQEVFEQLVREETKTGIYRTRLAAHVLCEWAAART